MKRVLMIGVLALLVAACSNKALLDKAKSTGVKYWSEKAYPGEGYEVEVVSAKEVEDAVEVTANVDGETRVGIYDPETGLFTEKYFSLSKARLRKIAELEQEVKYLKDEVAKLEKENDRLKFQMKMLEEKKK